MTSSAKPYQAPLSPPQAAPDRQWLLSPTKPHAAVATWFLGVFLIHVPLMALAGRLGVVFQSAAESLDFSPLFWLLLAAGIYFRHGFVRRSVLLLGLMLIFGGLVGGIVAAVGPSAEAKAITAGSLHIENPSILAVWLCFMGLASCFLYPVVVLWPAKARSAFRDRLPAARLRH
jgi:hypothetical protein